MYYSTATTIKGHLTGTVAHFQQGDRDGQQRAIDKVEAAERLRQRELEVLAGEPLTLLQLQRGTIDHPETRSRDELRRLKVEAIRPVPMPDDGYDRAMERLQRQIDDSKLTIREKHLKYMQEQRPSTPEPKHEPTAEARRFLQNVRFTRGATVEHVERAEALLNLSGDEYQTAMKELADDIKATIYDRPMAVADAAANAIRERAAAFDVEKPTPAPVPVPDNLGNDIRELQRKIDKAKL